VAGWKGRKRVPKNTGPVSTHVFRKWEVSVSAE
jgi:hypothetical protein